MKHFVITTVAACSLISAANAGFTAEVIAFSSLSDWQAAPSNADIGLFSPGYSAEIYIEDFKGSAVMGASAVSGGTGWASWTAHATVGGLRTTGTGLYAETGGASITMDFTDHTYQLPMGGVRGIGGGFQCLNAQGDVVAGKMWLKLSTGESIYRTISAADQFMGFWVADPTQVITSFKLQPMGVNAGVHFVGLETMYLGTAVIPAPGAIALLGAAGLIGGARRRR